MKIALDWTPNVMHAGLFVAKAKGWLDVDFISPAVDDYSVSPSEKVLSGMVDFGIGSPETVINHHLTESSPQLLIVSPLLQQNTSAFVALKEKNIRQISDWAGKTYAELGIPLEPQLLERMVRNAGPGAHLHVTTPLKLDTWRLLLAGETDLTWIFLPVEGAEAEYKGIELELFRPEDYGIPYPHCPLIFTSRNLAEADVDAVVNFRRVAERGYQYAVDYPEEAVQCLRRYSELSWIEDMRMLLHQQRSVNPCYLNEHGLWGQVNEWQLNNYLRWLHAEGIIAGEMDVHQLYYRSAVEETAPLESEPGE
jgi:ABC-type nitrate/sulfonate/bicarbonate transport system substrate-binding protein